MKYLLVLLLFAFTVRGIAAPLPEEVLTALKSPGKVTLHSLEPYPEHPGKREKLYFGHRVRGSVQLKAREATVACRELLDALLTPPHSPEGVISVMACFKPRHAIEVTSGKSILHFVICYECEKLKLYGGTLSGTTFPIRDDPKVLNTLLKKHRLPLFPRGGSPSP